MQFHTVPTNVQKHRIFFFFFYGHTCIQPCFSFFFFFFFAQRESRRVDDFLLITEGNRINTKCSTLGASLPRGKQSNKMSTKHQILFQLTTEGEGGGRKREREE